MLGYVQIYKPDLKVREYEIYQGYYCGICKYIGSRYGQLPRMALSYDAAFLACLLAGVDDTPDAPVQEHCAVHHIKKKTIIRNDAIEYAGDVMLLLAWYKLIDDMHDEGSLSARAALKFYRPVHEKLVAKYPDLCEGIEWNLDVLNGLENDRCASIDQVAEPFARIMEVIFREGFRTLYGSTQEGSDAGAETSDCEEEGLHEIFAKAGYHMGKWIYLMDAADDIEENIADGVYNPLLYRFSWKEGSETPAEFRARINHDLAFNLYHYLAVISEQTAELDIKKNRGIIDNIIYFGMNRKTETVLDKTDEPDKPAEEKINNESI